ncbi:MAG TPA: hypothetical protein VGQ93_05860 [Lysobacter sp.]|jgi:hypothetical protein|nr:hypothetical protein [Lysobacter sp.]
MSELQDLVALIRANTLLIVIEPRDEAPVVELFRQAMMQAWRAGGRCRRIDVRAHAIRNQAEFRLDHFG